MSVCIYMFALCGRKSFCTDFVQIFTKQMLSQNYAQKVILENSINQPPFRLKPLFPSGPYTFVKKRDVMPIWGHNIEIGVREVEYHTTMTILTQIWSNLVQRLGRVRIEGNVSNSIFLNAAQPETLGRYERSLYLTCQVSLLVWTSKPEFKNVAPERYHIRHKTSVMLYKL